MIPTLLLLLLFLLIFFACGFASVNPDYIDINVLGVYLVR